MCTHSLWHGDRQLLLLKVDYLRFKFSIILFYFIFIIFNNKWIYYPSNLCYDNLTINTNNLERRIIVLEREAKWTDRRAEQRIKYYLSNQCCLPETVMGEEVNPSWVPRAASSCPVTEGWGLIRSLEGFLTIWGKVFRLVPATVHLRFGSQLAIIKPLNKISTLIGSHLFIPEC